MSQFNEEQLKELEKIFGLERVAETLPVRDGLVTKKDEVWWRCEGGPELTIAGKDWCNIKNYPQAYSLEKPRVKVTYLD